MPKAEHLFRIGIILLILAMGSGSLALIDPVIRKLPRFWFDVVNWTTSLVWLSASTVLLASAVSLAASRLKVSDNAQTHLAIPMPLASRFAVVLVACWICSLPHAYIVMPHFKMAFPLYITGMEAYATGNALAAFIVCASILLLARRKQNVGLTSALVAAVIINAGFVFEYTRMSHAIR